MTPQQLADWERRFLESEERRTATDLPRDVRAQEERALESATEAEKEGALFRVGPGGTNEDLAALLDTAEDRAEAKVESAKQVVRVPGEEGSSYEKPMGRSRLVVGTGGQVIDEETGDLRDAGPFEQLYESVFRKRIAEADPFSEKIRSVREGEMTREEAGLADYVNLNVPLSKAGLEEAGYAAGLRFLGAVEPFINENIFGKTAGFDKEMLFYGMDEDGAPIDPEAPAYKAELWLKENFPDYAKQGMLIRSGGDELIDSIENDTLREAVEAVRRNTVLQTAATRLPRPFQGTTRQKGLMAASREGDYIARVADQIAEGRSAGDEFVSLPLYSTEMDELYGTTFGMPAAFVAGTAFGTLVPTPLGPLFSVAKGAGRLGAGAARATAAATGADSIKVVADLLEPWQTAKKLANRKAARDALGVELGRDALEAPTLRSIAVSRAIGPAAAAVELKGVVHEALDANGAINYAEMGRRFGGDAHVAGLLEQAFLAGDDATKAAGRIDPFVLDDVVSDVAKAADYRVILDQLREGATPAGEIGARLRKIVGKTRFDRLGLDSASPTELQKWLEMTMKRSGPIPNTKNGFVAGLYSTARDIMADMASPRPVGDILNRSIKGMGTSGRLFRDNVLRSVIEEAAGAGKDVSRIIGKVAAGDKAPSPAKLRQMVGALGDGRGRVAIGKAFRETMTAIGRDRILQHLPDDYVLVSRKMMVAEKSAAKARRAISRMARAMFDVSKSGTERVVNPVGSTTADDLVRMFVQEAGPGAAGAGGGSKVAKGVVRKLKKGLPLNEEEHVLFAGTMKDAIARRVVGSIEAVTEGAQTAVARSSAALRNKFYTDAYSQQSVGRFSRGLRVSLAAAGELIPLARESAKGNAAASLLISDKVYEGIPTLAQTSFRKFVDTFWGNPLKKFGNPMYGYKPETSVVAEGYARQIADLTGSAGDRIIDTFNRLAQDEKIHGAPAFTRVVKDMGSEVDEMARVRFKRSLVSNLERRGSGTVMEEALLTARYLVSSVTMIAREGRFKGGEGVIDAELIELGVREGIEGVRQLADADAQQLLEDAVVRALAKESNAEMWQTLLQTLMPGKAMQDYVILGLGQRPIQMNLAQAVNAIKQGGEAIRDMHGNLVPNLENSRAVLGLLAEKNGADILDSTLRYVDWKGNDAWTKGSMSWLAHQRAGLDAGRVFTRMADERPELMLDLVPTHSGQARDLQAASVGRVVEEMMKLEEGLTGKRADRRTYENAYLDAQRVLRAGDDPAGLRLDPLARSLFNVMKQMERIDFTLSAEHRISLGTAVMKRMASGRGSLPDLGGVGDKLVRELLDYTPTSLATLTAEQKRMLGVYGGSLASRHEISRPFQDYMREALRQADKRIDLGTDLFANRMVDLLYNGVLKATDKTMLTPIYKQFDSLWRRAGLRLDAGDLPGFDGSIILPQAVRPQYGPIHYMVGTNSVQSALDKVASAVSSGRLQSQLSELSLKAELADAKRLGTTGATVEIAATAAKQVAQSTVRIARSTLLAGGGFIVAPLPNVLYHAGNVQSVPELLTATLGAEMAVKVLRQTGAGLDSAGRSARSAVFRKSWEIKQAVGRAMSPGSRADDVVINTPFYGDITSGELDEMMDLAGIKFSRASIEAYESIAEQMADAARINIKGDPTIKPKGYQRLLRALDPRGMHEWMKFAEDTDGVTRRATFIAALVDGRTMEEAAMLARESLLDYGKVAATGSVASQFMQKWTMYWAFRRQSLIMTLNNLSDGKFGRQEMMGRWIRLQGQQKKGASPEEFLFGESYKQFRMYATPTASDVGFTMGAPSVLSEGAGDLLGFLATTATFASAAKALVTPGADDGDELFWAATKRLVDGVQDENIDVMTSTITEAIQAMGREDDRGPLISDTFMAQVVAIDGMTDSNIMIPLTEFFELEVDRDRETGEPVVTPGRPYLQAEEGSELVQPAHQFRFRTKGGYMKYLAVRLAMIASGSGRTPEEYTKLLLTIEALVPSGYKPQYRSVANILEYMTRTGTPMRKVDREEQRARIQKTRKRRVERAGR